jgi:hypothetical protein
MVDFRAVRRAMVDGQVRTNDVTDLDLNVWGCIGLRHRGRASACWCLTKCVGSGRSASPSMLLSCPVYRGLTGQREVAGLRREELHADGTWHLPGSLNRL